MDKEKIENKLITTYAEDMAEVIGDNQVGLVKKIIDEEEREEEIKRLMSPETTQNKLYIVFSVLFIIFAIVILAFLFFKPRNDVVVPDEQFAPIVFNDKSFFVETANLSKEQIVQAILTEIKNSDLKNGGLEGIYLTKDKQVIGLSSLLATLKSGFVINNPNLFNDNFLLGFVNQNTKGAFVLVKIKSVQDTFDAMKEWENKMFNDFGTLFGVSVSTENSYLLTKDFSDGFIENKNARILYDKDGQVILMYVFADDNSVIITNNTDAVREVIRRLSSGQIAK